MSEGLRLACVRVTAELMYDLFGATPPGQWFRVEEGLPPDAEYVRSYYDDGRNEFVFVYTHPTFPLTPPGHATARVTPMLSSIHLTLPFTADQRECIERCIVQQSRKANATDGADAPRIVEGG